MQYHGRSSRNAGKISAEFGHDLNRLVAYYQEVENEMRESGKYKFADPPSEKPESEEDVFDSLVSVPLAPEEFEMIETLAKARGICPGKLIREWVVERIASSPELTN